MLPGLSPLLVPGLQLEATESPAAAAFPRVAEKKRALLVIAGLARHIDATWPALEQAVVLPNEQAGYTFKIVFNTDAGLECHRESEKWNNRKCEEPTDPTAHLGRIRKFFGARDVSVLHDNATCLGQDRLAPWLSGGGAELDVPLDNVDDQRVGKAWTPCDPWFDRVHKVVAAVVKSGESFDRMVAMRPDIVLHPVVGEPHDRGINNPPLPPPPAPPQLLLDKMCAEKPGFSLVTGAWRRKFWMHDRDGDFMNILCPGEELPTYAEATRVAMYPCGKNRHGKHPPLPPGYHSDRAWDARAAYCRFVQTFYEHNVSMHHWDDSYTIDWPSGFLNNFP